VIVAIQHVPTVERSESVADLRRQLEGWAREIHVIRDAERRGPQWSWREALRTAAPDEHLLVLQDDVRISAPVEAIDEAISVRPRSILCLWFPRKSGADALARGYSWMRLQGLWCCGVVYPPGMPAQIVAWADANVPEGYRHDDVAVSVFMKEHGLTAFAPLPGLVEHRDEIRSTLGHGQLPAGRRAQTSWVQGAEYANRDWLGEPYPWKTRTVEALKKSLR